MNISLTEEKLARKERLAHPKQFKLKWQPKQSILEMSLYNIIRKDKKK